MNLSRGLLAFTSLSLLFVTVGCSDSLTTEAVGQNRPPNPAAEKVPPEGRFGPGGEGRVGGTSLRQIMNRLAQGPQSLTRVLGDGLEADKPDWSKIEPQAKEYADLAGQMADLRPPRGTPESWEKLTKSYLDAAKSLHKAVEAKDIETALKAHNLLANSCNDCHREHRAQGRGGFGGGGFGGGPGGPGGGFGGGFGGPPQVGQILSTNMQDRLNLSEDQRKEIAELQKEADLRGGVFPPERPTSRASAKAHDAAARRTRRH